MAASGTVGSVTTSLHPLVIMNISEHWTRTKAQAGKPQKVFGALIGKQKGRNIEVMNSFELDYTVLEEKVIIDRDYYNMKEEQFKQVNVIYRSLNMITVIVISFPKIDQAAFLAGYLIVINCY
jgi:COP9 signalosome complex subunit 6